MQSILNPLTDSLELYLKNIYIYKCVFPKKIQYFNILQFNYKLIQYF